MRVLFSFAILFTGLLLSGAAQAGKVSYVDGRGQWMPTGCTAPVQPQGVTKNAEAAANAMNAAVAQHNAYVDEAQAYMECVSREAQHDAQAFGQLITTSAQDIINQTQQDVAASAARAHTKPAIQ